jgi:hypothetical protein
MTRPATPKKHAMAMTITQSGLLMAWEVVTVSTVGVVATGTGTRRRWTSDESSRVGGKFLRTAVAFDMAVILFMRSGRFAVALGNKRKKLKCPVDFVLPGARYGCNARMRRL